MNLIAISAAIWVTVMASCVAALLILSRWHGRPVAVVEDPTPYPEELDDEGLLLAVDPPVVPAYVDDLVLFYGVAVHKRCLVPYLRTGARPCAGCAVHLDHVLTGA